MQIKPQRYHFTTIKMDIINKKQKITTWQGYGERDPLCTAGNVKTVQLLWKMLRQYLKKLNIPTSRHITVKMSKVTDSSYKRIQEEHSDINLGSIFFNQSPKAKEIKANQTMGPD